MRPTQKSATASLAQDLPSLDFQNPFSQPGWVNGTSTFLPMHMEKHYAYPLLVWLSDDNRADGQLSRIMPKVSLRNYIGIAPLSNLGGHSQLKLHATDDQRLPDDLDSSALLAQTGLNEQIFAALDRTCLQYNINTSRIFIAGEGTGGTLAMQLAMTHAEYFAGVISLGGELPKRGSSLRNLRSIRKTPVFLSQSRGDVSYAESTLCEDLRLLHVGGFSVTARQYPGSQRVHDQMLHDIDVWMMETINGYDMTASEQTSHKTR